MSERLELGHDMIGMRDEMHVEFTMRAYVFLCMYES